MCRLFEFSGSRRRFRCGTYWLVSLVWTAAAFLALSASVLGLARNPAVSDGVAIGAIAVSGSVAAVLVWIVSCWFLRVDPNRRVLEVRRGRTLRCVDFEDVVRVEIPSEPQVMPRNVTLLLGDDERVICPFVSQGSYLRASSLDRLEAHLAELGVSTETISAPRVSPFPRFVRNAFGRQAQ